MENFTNDSLFRTSAPSSYEDDTEDGIVAYRHDYERYIIGAIFAVASILGTVGNSFVITAVTLSRKLRTSTNVFVVNLAIGDMLTCSALPWQTVVIWFHGWPIPQAKWLCAAAGFITVVTFGVSINSLALIAVNRWVGITKSRYTTRRIYTARKLGLMVFCSWAIPLSCALTPVLTDFGQLGYEKLYSTCTWDRSNPYSFYYNMLLTGLYYPVQLIIITVCYSSIFCYVCRTSRKMTRADAPSVSAKIAKGENRSTKRKLWKRQLKVTKNLFYIIVAFIICLSPYFMAIMLVYDWTYRLTPWAGAFMFSNSCVNPFIYATSHPDFKEAFRYMIRCKKIPVSGSVRRNRSFVSTSSAAVNGGYASESNK